jgi:hypothetical protein
MLLLSPVSCAWLCEPLIVPIYTCVSVCVCVCEREREREREHSFCHRATNVRKRCGANNRIQLSSNNWKQLTVDSWTTEISCSCTTEFSCGFRSEALSCICSMVVKTALLKCVHCIARLCRYSGCNRFSFFLKERVSLSGTSYTLCTKTKLDAPKLNLK